MIIANRQAQYKYSSTAMQLRQEKGPMVKNIKKGRFPFIARALKIGLVALIIGLVVILYVHQYVQISTANYQIESLEKQLTDLENRNDKIQLRISENRSLKRVEEAARERLGFIEPGSQDVLYIAQATEQGRMTEPVEIAAGEENRAIWEEVGAWFKNLTSVEAGTLDE